MNTEGEKIHKSWKKILKDEFKQPYFSDIKNYLHIAKSQGITIYPPESKIYNAFDSTPFDKVKVIVVGQDPYHGHGEAMGLSFSVPYGKRTPPSLRNIFKELKNDIGMTIPSHGDLSEWADQGVFLLNAILTVEHQQASSHKNIGWITFTNAVIKHLSVKKENLVFLLWGRFAQSKSGLIDQSKHHVLTAAHPSPMARGGFYGCKHFSKTNDILNNIGLKPINWNLGKYE
ncbi:MAG: uracil-DNA glycosylase [Saprospiraceae bacterium]